MKVTKIYTDKQATDTGDSVAVKHPSWFGQRPGQGFITQVDCTAGGGATWSVTYKRKVKLSESSGWFYIDTSALGFDETTTSTALVDLRSSSITPAEVTIEIVSIATASGALPKINAYVAM